MWSVLGGPDRARAVRGVEVRVGSLFSGIGGFDLGLQRAGMEITWQVEIDEYCRRVLEKHWPGVPRFGDIRECGAHNLGPVDLICGGFPCQPFSHAGKRKGKDDDRHLWPEMLRVISEVRPRWIIGENVPGIISMELDNLLSDLEGEGYSCETLIIPACAVDARHRRDRVWIVAHHEGLGALRLPIRSWGSQQAEINIAGQSEDVAYPETIYAQRFKNRQRQRESGGDCRWPVEPDICRVAYGIPRRVERLKALGNAVVPQIPEILGRMIMEVEHGDP